MIEIRRKKQPLNRRGSRAGEAGRAVELVIRASIKCHFGLITRWPPLQFVSKKKRLQPQPAHEDLKLSTETGRGTCPKLPWYLLEWGFSSQLNVHRPSRPPSLLEKVAEPSSVPCEALLSSVFRLILRQPPLGRALDFWKPHIGGLFLASLPAAPSGEAGLT